MASILDDLMGSLQRSGGVGELARSLGLQEGDVNKVLGGALPALLNGLSNEANSSDGATNLLAALDRDHDGSILDDVAGFLRKPGNSDPGILRHTLGDRQPHVEHALSRSTGVDTSAIGDILAAAAPLVMGYLSRQKQQQNLDAEGVANMLGREQQVMRQRSPQAADLLTRLLDSDGDGDVTNEVARMGSDLLGKLFKT